MGAVHAVCVNDQQNDDVRERVKRLVIEMLRFYLKQRRWRYAGTKRLDDWCLMYFPSPPHTTSPPPRSKMVAFSKLYYLVWRKIRRGWCNLCWWYRLFYWYTYCVRLTYLFYILSRLLKMKPRTVYMFNFLATQRCFFLFCFSDYCYDRWNMYELFLLSKWCCISVYM